MDKHHLPVLARYLSRFQTKTEVPYDDREIFEYGKGHHATFPMAALALAPVVARLCDTTPIENLPKAPTVADTMKFRLQFQLLVQFTEAVLGPSENPQGWTGLDLLTPKEVFLVQGRCGDHSDQLHWVVATYFREEHASTHVDKARSWVASKTVTTPSGSLSENLGTVDFEPGGQANPFDPNMEHATGTPEYEYVPVPLYTGATL